MFVQDTGQDLQYCIKMCTLIYRREFELYCNPSQANKITLFDVIGAYQWSVLHNPGLLLNTSAEFEKCKLWLYK